MTSSDSYLSGGAMDRRTFLKASAGAATLTAAGAGASAPVAAQSDLSGWFENVSNYDGVVDKTGNSEVTIEVGATGNNGNFAFGPAAVRVDPGTKVVWKWTGKGGSHNVVAEDGSFKSEMVGEAGHTFSQTFDSEGVTKYACSPHKPMGMKGAVVVGTEAASSAESVSGSAEAAGSAGSSLGDTLTLGFGGVLFAVLLGLPLAEIRSRRKQE